MQTKGPRAKSTGLKVGMGTGQALGLPWLDRDAGTGEGAAASTRAFVKHRWKSAASVRVGKEVLLVLYGCKTTTL